MTHPQADPHRFQCDSITLVLGYKNTPQGELLAIMQQRASEAVKVAQQFNTPVLCTGGWGDKFNRHSLPHARLVQYWMQQQGIATERFLPYAASRNTYEDGKLSAEIIRLFRIKKVYLVTSDFHMLRGFLWLRHFSPQVNIICKAAKTLATEAELQALKAHEKQAIAQFYHDFPDTQAVDIAAIMPPVSD